MSPGSTHIDSASADGQFEALSKYSLDLVQMAREGKLDPVIGRDDEVHRGLLMNRFGE
jgi:ATP-dependent Clp protease ATP-binding subunit ClpB